MKSIAFICLAVCLTAVCATEAEFARRGARDLLGKSASASSSSSAKSTTPGGQASASTTAHSTGGTAEAVASATSESFTEVSNSLVEYFKYVFDHVRRKSYFQSKEDYCKNALSSIRKQLKAVGSVVASAYTEALATVEITGTGSACAQSAASARSQAAGFSRVLAQAIAEASYRKSRSEAAADVEAVSTVIATAFANAFSKACVEDEGSSLALQTSFAQAVARPIATVSVYVVAGVDCREVKGYSLTEVEGGTSSEEEVEATSESMSETTGKGTSTTEGTSGATTAELYPCSGKYRSCCIRRGRTTCTCLPTRSGTCHATYVKGDVSYWQEGDMQCTCSRMMSYRVELRIEQ